jgi:integrase
MSTVLAVDRRADLDALKGLIGRGRHGRRNLALFVLGINTGLRVSDILALDVGDAVGPDRRVARAVDCRESKTGRRIRVDLNRAARNALAAWLRERGPCGRREPLFVSQKGGRLSRRSVLRIISEAGRALKMPGLGTHTMRKTFGCFVYNSTGGNLGLVMHALRHTSPRHTLRYIGVTSRSVRDATLKLNL